MSRSLIRTETTEANAYGHTTYTLLETAADGAWLRTTTEIVAQFSNGVQAIRRSVASRGFAPNDDTDACVKLRIDPEMTDMPSPIEHAKTNALLMQHIHDLIAISDRFGYIGKPSRLEFMARTRGHGCLPVVAGSIIE